MNILVTGASRLIGSALLPRLEANGHRVVPLSRRSVAQNGPRATWNIDAGQIDLSHAGPLDAVIHLAGETIAQRWTHRAKIRICSSRVGGTRLLANTLAKLPQPPRVMVCASATGFYGDQGDELLDESSPAGNGFLADVCRTWEIAAEAAAQRGIRVLHLRTGIVLARHGGALAKMLPAFRLGLGGPIGNGRQYWCWIALDDLLEVILHALRSEQCSGPINAVAPNPVTQREFARTLGDALHRPSLLPVPAFAIRLLLGEMAQDALLASVRVKPLRLEQSGFVFRFPDLAGALRHLLG